jgi:hypothetical protein
MGLTCGCVICFFQACLPSSAAGAWSKDFQQWMHAWDYVFPGRSSGGQMRAAGLPCAVVGVLSGCRHVPLCACCVHESTPRLQSKVLCMSDSLAWLACCAACVTSLSTSQADRTCGVWPRDTCLVPVALLCTLGLQQWG